MTASTLPADGRLEVGCLTSRHQLRTGVSGGRPPRTATTFLDRQIGHRGPRLGRGAAQMRHEHDVLERQQAGWTSGSFS